MERHLLGAPIVNRKSRSGFRLTEGSRSIPISSRNCPTPAGGEANPRSRAHSYGFSLIESIIVVSIVIVLSAIALPIVLNAVYLIRLRNAANDLSGLVQLARITAEKTNSVLPVFVGTVETISTGGFIGAASSTCSSTNSWASGESDVPFANGVTAGTAASAPTGLSPGFTPETAGTVLYFSSRGFPVKSNSGACKSSAGVVFYLQDTHGNWGAVSVSGAGRSKPWVYDGASWH